MGVEPVHVPPANKTGITPGPALASKVGTDQYWREKALEARARREYVEEEKNIENLNNPPAPPESPIAVKGEINLGKFDFQEQSRQAQAALEASRQESNNRITALEAENKKLQADLIANTINNLQTTLGGQIQKLQTDLITNRGNSRSVADQLKEIMETASLMGLVRPESQKTPVPIANATDAAISLEMLRLQLEDKKTEREFAWQLEKDRRQWQLDLRKLDQANKQAMAAMENQKIQSSWIAKAPEMIGNTIVRGLLAARDNTPHNPVTRRVPGAGAGSAAARTQESPPNIENEATASMSGRRLTAAPGEAGTIECPDCQSIIAIGPTADNAVCATCGFTVSIERKEVPNAV